MPDSEKILLQIDHIREESGIIRFDVAGGRPEITATTALEAENVNGTSFLSRWNKSQDSATVLLKDTTRWYLKPISTRAFTT